MGKICPKCKYERSRKDDPTILKTICPNCGVVYAKAAVDTLENKNRSNLKKRKVVSTPLGEPKKSLGGLIGGYIDSIFSKKIESKTSVPRYPVCPYCKEILDKRPQRKKKCPHCKNYIFVKRRPNREEKELVTEEDAQVIEIEWNKIHEQNNLISEIQKYGFTENEFRKAKNRFKGEVSNRDVIWSLLNEKSLYLAKKGDYRAVSAIHYNQARFLVEEGRDPYQMLYQSTKMELLDYKNQGVKRVEISHSENGCESCEKLGCKEYTIDKALKEMPLPNKGCTMDVFGTGASWCRCLYHPKF